MIDPSIWQSEDFGKLSTLAKLVFIGLFSLADDEGKGRCNPVYLKSTLFPYEEGIRSADIDKTLSEISSNMSVVLYSCNGSNYYSLYNWNTWQKIDKPSESKIPDFDEKTCIRLLFDEHSTNGRRTFSPNKKGIEKEKEKKEIESEFCDVYSRECTKLPQIRTLTDSRKKAIGLFLKTYTLKDFEEVCRISNTCGFLLGENDRGWKADFDFLIKVNNAVKILEGKYSGNTKQTTNNAFKDNLTGQYGDLSQFYMN